MLVVSDIHFGTGPPDPEPLIAGLVALAGRTSGRTVLIAGDFTQRASTREYLLAGRLIQALIADGVHVVATPGNHDFGGWLGEKFSSGTARERYLREVFDPVAVQPIVRATRDVDLIAEIGADIFLSLRSTHARWRKAGRIRKAQIAWAVEAVKPRLSVGRRVHVITHRALWRDVSEEHSRMSKVDRLVEGLLAPLNVETILAGHNHVMKSGLRTVGTRSWPILQISAPTLSEERERGGSDAGLLEWDVESARPPWFIAVRDVMACSRSI